MSFKELENFIASPIYPRQARRRALPETGITEKRQVSLSARVFSSGQRSDPQEYFVYFKEPIRKTRRKRTADSRHEFLRRCPRKKGAGRNAFAPLIAPVSRRAMYAVVARAPLSGGQNLTASCTTAGQNLTAVGSSHSLPESVNLGTVTAAGLVGTLHWDTPPQKSICSTAENGRSNTKSIPILGHARVL